MRDVRFIVNAGIFNLEAQLLIKGCNPGLGMDIYPAGDKGEGAFYQQFAKLLAPMFFKDGYTFELGTLFCPPNSQGACRFSFEQEQQVGARYVLAIKVNLFSYPLPFDEYTSANILASAYICLSRFLSRYALLYVYELCFHDVHTTSKRSLGARAYLIAGFGPPLHGQCAKFILRPGFGQYLK